MKNLIFMHDLFRIFDPPPGFFLFFKIISFGNSFFFQIFSCFFAKMTTIPLGSMSKIHKSVYPCSQLNKSLSFFALLLTSGSRQNYSLVSLAFQTSSSIL